MKLLLGIAVTFSSLTQIPVGAQQQPHLQFLSPLTPTVEGSAVTVQMDISGAVVDVSLGGVSLCLGLKQHDDGTPFSVSPETDSLHCLRNDLVWMNGTVLAWSTPPTMRLKSIPRGDHVVWAVLRQGPQGGAVVGDVAVQRFSVVPPVFQATYEWKPIVQGQSVEPGLEVRMDLGVEQNGNHGRIPDPWRLQVWLPEANRFVRHDVRASTTVEELVGAARSALYEADPSLLSRNTCIRLVERSERDAGGSFGDNNNNNNNNNRAFSMSSTASQERLFDHRGGLHFEVTEKEDEGGCD